MTPRPAAREHAGGAFHEGGAPGAAVPRAAHRETAQGRAAQSRAAQDPRRDISLWINSPGGSVPAMLAIMDVMRIIPNDVSTHAMGLACSAGQFLLTADSPRDRWFTAEEALAHGFVDRVITGLDDVRPRPAASATAGVGS